MGTQRTGTGAPVNIYTTQNECPKSERSPDDNKDYIVDGDGNYLETTAQHYVLVIGADGSTSRLNVDEVYSVKEVPYLEHLDDDGDTHTDCGGSETRSLLYALLQRHHDQRGKQQRLLDGVEDCSGRQGGRVGPFTGCGLSCGIFCQR